MKRISDIRYDASEGAMGALSESPSKRVRMQPPPQPLQPHLQPFGFGQELPAVAPPPGFGQPGVALPPADGMLLDSVCPPAPPMASSSQWPPPGVAASCPPCFAHRFCRGNICSVSGRPTTSNVTEDDMMLG